MRRTVIAALSAAVLVGTFTAPQAGLAAGSEPALQDVFPVAPGIDRELRSWQTPGGPQRINVLRFSLDDPNVSLRPELGGGQVAGREPVHQTVLRAGPDAVAGVNAGFWLDDPSGDPEGLLIQDGRYVSEPASQGSGPRAAFALFGDGSWEVGRPDHRASVWFPSGRSGALHGINRGVPYDRLVAMNSGFAATTGAADDAVEAVFALELEPNTFGTYEVREVRGPNGRLPAGHTVLVGRGVWAAELAALRPGDRVTFDLRSSEPWRDAIHALAAGPLLVADGKRVPRDDWEIEGFSHKVHNDRAHPRTVIGFTADREVLLVTIDGRRSASVGLTSDETATMMLELGAVDAVMLDGGGSTTMAVDGRIVNRPCCDSPGFRWVSNSLVVRSHSTTPAVERLSGEDRFATAAAVAAHGWPNGASHVLLASGGAFPDGLAGGPLAARLGVPLLLTPTERLVPATANALTSLGVQRVTVLGGASAVSDAVLAGLAGRGLQVERIAGPARTDTAAAVAQRLGAPTGRAILANGWGFADALAAVVPAHAAQAPLLLTAPDGLPEVTRAALAELKVREVVIAGGSAVVSDAVAAELAAAGYQVTRVAGKDRFSTAVALVDWARAHAGLVPRGVAVASAFDFPDALAGGPLAALRSAPVLLSQHVSLARSGPSGAWLDANPVDRGYLFGGRAALSTWIEHEVQAVTER